MLRLIALAAILSAPAAMASELDDLPEADVAVETAPTETVDLSDDDDIDFAEPTANAIATAEPMTRPIDADIEADEPTVRTAFAPAPKLPSLDDVEFEDDFEFEAAPSAASRASAKVSNVEFVDLDGEADAAKPAPVEEEARPELELDMVDDLEDEAIELDEPAPAGDVGDLLSDDDDIELEW